MSEGCLPSGALRTVVSVRGEVEVHTVDVSDPDHVHALVGLRLESLRVDGGTLLGQLRSERTRSVQEWHREVRDGCWFLGRVGG